MRRMLLLMGAVAVVGMSVIVLSAVPGVGRAGRQAARVCTWRTFPVESTGSDLRDVEASLGSDVWAVGAVYPDLSEPLNPVKSLILHWDGSRWERADVPVSGVHFEAVSGSSRSDVWAVGYRERGIQGSSSVVVHWNGVRWRRVPSPNDPRSSTGWLGDVVAVSRTEAWAVGSAGLSGRDRPLVLHWNGRAWTRVAVPVAKASLSAVDATSRTNVWAVGYRDDTERAVLALHWNGRKWESTPLPPAQLARSGLGDVSVVSGTEAWAVGSSSNGDPHNTRVHAYTVRWIRNRWQIDHAAETFRPYGYGFGGLHAESPTRVWAWDWGSGKAGDGATLGLWDGQRWRAGPGVPFGGRTDASVQALDTSPDGALWLIGSYYDNSGSGMGTALIARYACHG